MTGRIGSTLASSSGRKRESTGGSEDGDNKRQKATDGPKSGQQAASEPETQSGRAESVKALGSSRTGNQDCSEEILARLYKDQDRLNTLIVKDPAGFENEANIAQASLDRELKELKIARDELELLRRRSELLERMNQVEAEFGSSMSKDYHKSLGDLDSAIAEVVDPVIAQAMERNTK